MNKGASPAGDRARSASPTEPLRVSSPDGVTIPSAVLDEVAFAIERARCPGRDGPYGGYDYGHNTAFYGPEPEAGRYVVRDFRNPRSPDFGKFVHQTHSRDEHEQELLRLTGRHLAQAAINAFAQGMSARQSQDPQGLGPEAASLGRRPPARSRRDAPKPPPNPVSPHDP